ncbi:hypothetical protein ADT25_12750 [Xanthomonas oryzae]|uniref:Uncharacterized protein n=1 Tax=Xanthomonas oryzae TaxID=347 RepID=A0AAP1EYF8_9XANT|nr:hypothetical protein ADT25_12750 [Xanthomonas oryzae]
MCMATPCGSQYASMGRDSVVRAKAQHLPDWGCLRAMASRCEEMLQHACITRSTRAVETRRTTVRDVLLAALDSTKAMLIAFVSRALGVAAASRSFA